MCEVRDSELTYKIIFIVSMIHHIVDVLVKQQMRRLDVLGSVLRSEIKLDLGAIAIFR